MLRTKDIVADGVVNYCLRSAFVNSNVDIVKMGWTKCLF